jgi:4-hydroxy-tetrahydrodipicolinate reductase
MSEPIRVAVNGANGHMGGETCRAVTAADDMSLVAQCDRDDDLAGQIRAQRADVVVDFTVASAGLENLETILSAGAAAVIGTSGFGPKEVAKAQALCAQHGRPALIAPNFALGAILLARCAALVARHMPHVELIEAHHDRKEDAPSGTSLKIAGDIAAVRPEVPRAPESESVDGVRGGVSHGVRIHSIRVPGIVARMECLFGGAGETLTLRHDTLTRESFMPGVLLAIRQVASRPGVTVGLESLLDL